MTNDIAYVGSDLKIHLISAQNGQEIQINGPGKTNGWPVWSPKGEHLAFSSFSSGSNGHGLLSLCLLRVGATCAHQLYRNRPGTDAIAKNTPHYSLWSPDGTRLAFVTRTMEPGLTLFVSKLSKPEEPFQIITGMPMFISWSPDSRYLLVHSGMEHYLVDFLGNNGITKLDLTSSLYMAPSWSLTSKEWAVMNQKEKLSQSLIVGDVDSGESGSVIDVQGAAAFSWSPNGKQLALVRGQHPETKLYEGLFVVNLDGTGEIRLTGDPVVAFYWAHEGSEIAYLTTVENASGLFRWGIVDTETGSLKSFSSFSPTQEQLTTFVFFDQYTQSHSPWSSDSARLIYSRRSFAHGEFADSSIFVLDTKDGDETQVAEGVFGCWSRI